MSGRALVVGTAECAISDLAAFAAEYGSIQHEIFIVNEAFRFVRRWDYWVSLHPERMRAWDDERALTGRQRGSVHLPDLDVDDWAALERRGGRIQFPHRRHEYRVPECPEGGSSGLFATRLAIRFGCDRVVLAGVPMDHRPHVGSLEPWSDRDRFVTAWGAVERELKGKVKSMNGWTRDFLGEPTLQWWCH